MRWIFLLLIPVLTAVAMAKDRVFDVKAFGAKGDGAALDTVSVQKAIEACHTNTGGKVYFPPGTYRVGTLALKSNVRVYLEAGARLLGSRNLGDYVQRPAGEFCHLTGSAWVLLHGVGVENVTLEGKGTVDGANAGFTNAVTGQWQRGPLGVLFERSTNICLLDLTVTKIPAWSVTFFDCASVSMRRIRVLDVMADGINPVCSRNVLYDSVLIDGTGDDPITIKNEGPVTGLPLTSDIVISNCTVRNTTHPGFKIGTGTAGVFRNILVRDCTFDISGTAFTIQLIRQTLDPERAIENLCISNVSVRAKQLFDLTTMGVERPVMRNLSFSHINYRGADRGVQASRIWGTSHAPIRNLVIADLTVQDAGVGAWLSLEHVEGGRLTGLRLDLPESKTVLKAVSCGNLQCEGWTVERLGPSGPVISLENVRGFVLTQARTPGVTNWLSVFGSDSRDITPPGAEAGAAQIPLLADTSVPSSAFAALAEGVRLKNLHLSRALKPNQPVDVAVTISGAARPGPWQLRVREGATELGAQWEWAFADRSHDVSFTVPALYRSGRHTLALDNLSAEVEVAPMPAAFQYGELAEIVSPAAAGALTRVKTTVKNIGGTAGEHRVELRADSRTIGAQTLRLEPGEERPVELAYRFPQAAPRVLTLGDYPPWPYFTAENVPGRFYWGHQRLIIEAGGPPKRRGTYATIYRAGIKGDFDAIARLHRQSMNTGENSEIGLVVRNDLTQTNATGFTTHFREPKYGAYKVWFLDLDGDGVLETRSDGGNTSMPGWYKFEKRGQQFRAYTSNDREHWSACGKWFALPSAAEVQDVGIYGNAASALGEMSRVEFSDFEVIPVSAETASPSGAIR